jgi:N-acetyl-gamma-glutamyl-phosphate reductase
VPEHLDRSPTPHVAHPGCFSTATLLASVPLLALDLVEPQIYVSAVTGSTGAGRSPIPGTHHPQRHSDLYAYNALTHRHAAEITALAATASGRAGRIAFSRIPPVRPRHPRHGASEIEATARRGRDRGVAQVLRRAPVRAR